MDWSAFSLSVELAAWTTVMLIPTAIVIARLLVWRDFWAKGFVEALIALPLVLPPTVLGFYLLSLFGSGAWVGQAWEGVFGRPLVFTFQGLLLASIVFNLPFAVQPVQRAWDGLPAHVREAAWCSGMSRWQTFWRIELPLAWPGVLSGAILTFAHTIGEFGVVLMVGGNIPEETRTVAIAVYDRVQAFDDHAAATMSGLLLGFSFIAIGLVYFINHRAQRNRRR